MYYISAWASALLVLLDRAMRRPQSVGRVTVQIPALFLLNIARGVGGTKQNNKMGKLLFSLLSSCDFTRKSHVVGTEKKKWAQWLLSMVLLLVKSLAIGD